MAVFLTRRKWRRIIQIIAFRSQIARSWYIEISSFYFLSILSEIEGTTRR